MSLLLPFWWLLLPPLLWFAAMLGWLLRGWWLGRAKRAVGQIIAGHLVLLASGWLLFVDGQPAVNTVGMTTEDKIALRDSMWSPPDSPNRHLSLDSRLIEGGLRTAAELVDHELHSRFHIDGSDRIDLQLAWGLPTGGYLNLTAGGRLSVRDGEAEIDVDRLRLGRLPLPSAVSRRIGGSALWLAERLPVTGRAMLAVRQAEIRDGRLEFEIRPQTNLSGELASRLSTPANREHARVAAEILVRLERQAGDDWQALRRAREGDFDQAFVEATRTLFRLAGETAPDWPAHRQNTAAILAGGIAFGHPRLAQVAGLSPEAADLPSVRVAAGSVRVHGRRDLAQHFWVSAALVPLSSNRISDKVGLTKEEMDSGRGGSGFSFADMLANRAGVRFAEIATAEGPSAEGVLRRLGEPWAIESLVPSIDGLPEGIPERELEDDFGGVGGTRFRELTAEIERRLDAAPLLLLGP